MPGTATLTPLEPNAVSLSLWSAGAKVLYHSAQPDATMGVSKRGGRWPKGGRNVPDLTLEDLEHRVVALERTRLEPEAMVDLLLSRVGALESIPQLAGPTVSSPTAGVFIHYGDTHTITWTGFNSARVRIRKDSPNGSWSVIADDAPNNGSYSWHVNGCIASDDYRITVMDAGDWNIKAQSPEFSIGPVPPTLEVIQPGAELYYPGDTIEIKWTGATGEHVEIDRYWTNPGGGNAGGQLFPSVPNSGVQLWEIPYGYLRYQFNMGYPENRIIVRDLANLSNWASSASFHIVKPDQRTEITVPSAGSVYSHHDYIEVLWSGFKGDTVTIELKGGGGTPIKREGIPNSGSHSMLIAKTPAIPASTEYRVLVYNLNDLEIAGSEQFTIQP